MPAERRAVLLLLGLAVVGQGLRLWTGQPDAAPGEIRVASGGPPRKTVISDRVTPT